MNLGLSRSRTGYTDYGRPMKSKSLDLDKQIGIFVQTISTHFGTVSPVSMFFIQSLCLQKTKHLYPHPKYFFMV